DRSDRLATKKHRHVEQPPIAEFAPHLPRVLGVGVGVWDVDYRTRENRPIPNGGGIGTSRVLASHALIRIGTGAQHRSEVPQRTVEASDQAAVSSIQPHRTPTNRVEHWLHVRW